MTDIPQKKPQPIRRPRSIDLDLTVIDAQREIERVFMLPAGSVRLVNPSKNFASPDISIEALKAQWGLTDLLWHLTPEMMRTLRSGSNPILNSGQSASQPSLRAMEK